MIALPNAIEVNIQMKLLRFKFLVLAFFIFGCSAIIDTPRSSLLNEKKPFGLSWSLTSEEKANFDAEAAAICAEIFDSLKGTDRELAIQSCVQNNHLNTSEELPPPLENGFLEVSYTPDGNLISHSHIFDFSSALEPELTETETQKRAQIIAYEIEQWRMALKLRYEAVSAYGEFRFGKFERTDEPDAACAAWYVKPVAILLCRSRPFSPDSSVSSLSFIRLDRVSRGRELQNQISVD